MVTTGKRCRGGGRGIANLVWVRDLREGDRSGEGETKIRDGRRKRRLKPTQS